MMINSPSSQHQQTFATLPYEGQRSLARSDRFATAVLYLSPQKLTKIEVHEYLLAALITVLARYNSEEQVCVAISRNNTVFPLRISTPKNILLSDLVEKIRIELHKPSGEYWPSE